MLLQGLQSVPESCLAELQPFYASIICSYCHVNTLFYAANKYLSLPLKLWGHPKSPGINYFMCKADYYTVVDLPIIHNKIDHATLQNKLNKSNHRFSAFLTCYQLQCAFGTHLYSSTLGSDLV